MGELKKLALALAEQLVVRRGGRARMACAAAGATARGGARGVTRGSDAPGQEI